ncbi:BnaA01g33180D [Brassica napus]|uniref:BnaA01g33180D protein n=1 Tax=Brassica napus TaxID=3708 RepID=A0A078HAG4_BRANA|nr:BnaA01g33180D [Brassica napus]
MGKARGVNSGVHQSSLAFSSYRLGFSHV